MKNPKKPRVIVEKSKAKQKSVQSSSDSTWSFIADVADDKVASVAVPGDVMSTQGPAMPAPHASAPPRTERPVPRHTIESVAVSDGGGLFITGWINDTADPLAELRISGGNWRVTDRRRRPGADLPRRRSVGARDRAPLSVRVLGPRRSTRRSRASGAECLCEIVMKSGASERHPVPLRVVFDQIELRNLALTYLSSSQYLGNPLARFGGEPRAAYRQADRRPQRPHLAGDRVAPACRALRHADRPAEGVDHRLPLRAGRIPDPAGGPVLRPAGYRGLRVHLCEQQSRTRRAAQPRRADRGAGLWRRHHRSSSCPAMPASAPPTTPPSMVAHSDRLLIVNPDVFPHDADWAARHTALIEQAPSSQTLIFGAPLYYDDGSLMHGGMYFDGDKAVLIEGSNFVVNLTLRVEHYGKGAPPLAREFLRPRPVPAVTGAFISCCARLVRSARRLQRGICPRPLRRRRSLPEEHREGRRAVDPRHQAVAPRGQGIRPPPGGA